MAEQEQNRTEQATPFKLAEAKKRGSVARSMELGALATSFGALLLAYVWGQDLIEKHLRLESAVFSQAHMLSFDSASLLRWLTHLLAAMGELLLPLFLVVVVLGILSSTLQTGPVFTFFPLKPDMKRLNPVTGFKRIFSKRIVFELGKTLVKLLLFSLLLYYLARAMAPALLGMLDMDPAGYRRYNFDLILSTAFKVLMLLAFIALLDILYTRWQYRDQMKMSRRELKDEVKNREGDPRIRSRLRELQRELVNRSKAVRRVPEADVLITNPVHLAVALLYKRDEMHAPQVIAKGSGELVEHMKALARQHGVPVVENKPLARKLFAKAEVGQAIPELLYPQVARVLLWVYARRDGQQRKVA